MFPTIIFPREKGDSAQLLMLWSVTWASGSIIKTKICLQKGHKAMNTVTILFPFS